STTAARSRSWSRAEHSPWPDLPPLNAAVQSTRLRRGVSHPLTRYPVCAPSPTPALCCTSTRSPASPASGKRRVITTGREATMSGEESDYRHRSVGGQKLHPETLMMGYGYDPLLSEGALKIPIFHTSTFVF